MDLRVERETRAADCVCGAGSLENGPNGGRDPPRAAAVHFERGRRVRRKVRLAVGMKASNLIRSASNHPRPSHRILIFWFLPASSSGSLNARLCDVTFARRPGSPRALCDVRAGSGLGM